MSGIIIMIIVLALLTFGYKVGESVTQNKCECNEKEDIQNIVEED